MLAPLWQEDSSAIAVPVIVMQPQSTNAAAGALATFSVVATGVALTYQWFQNNAPIAGATGASFTYGPVVYPSDSGSQFYVVVSNPAGLVTSGIGVLLVLLAPL